MNENKKELIKSLIDIGFDVDTISAISQAVDDLVDHIKSIPEFKKLVKESDAEATGEFINEIQEMTQKALHTAVDTVIEYSALELRNAIKEEENER